MDTTGDVLTLDEFRVSEVRNFPAATTELSNLLRDIAFAAKLINVEVNKAGLVDILGETGTVNVQGEKVKKLDLYAHQQLTGVLKRGISCAGAVSEEMEDVIVFDDKMSSHSKYIVAFDPLDGSSNIDNCISIGTIFGIYLRSSSTGQPCNKEDFMLQGKSMVAAGYVIYGSSTMLVFATSRSVNGFTLDPPIGEFYLSHPNIKCPENGNIYSINHSNYLNYSPGVQKYLDYFLIKNKEEEGSYTMRHVGSMVADLHRNLIKGGIFLNAATNAFPDGRLRLLYECNPWAFIYETAGGRAINGKQRILDVEFKDIHQRTPLFIGSTSMIQQLEMYLGEENL
ncbi:MAG: class 1 fructose-bisphosphatase [Segetibacter sp.]|jgi:fructose-1,6-bisphosphatase I|nr:class 1 fructose-bisphosphatase [Segetibacter sp.]